MLSLGVFYHYSRLLDIDSRYIGCVLDDDTLLDSSLHILCHSLILLIPGTCTSCLGPTI